ncbi:hypothetical protein SAY87_010613 [Trapa incisa]|uniref:Uncharacterized protein n=1 Tax=Trapa incisa TaxID=236973 RepID=A0AAN7GI13_9MYRT|nr:hypothetical protein SAY87_010613 [Trapa incisa]
MMSLLHISVDFHCFFGVLRGVYYPCKKRPIRYFSLSKPNLSHLLQPSCFNFRLSPPRAWKDGFLEMGARKNMILVGDGMNTLKSKRVVLARSNNRSGGFGFNNGGGGKDDGTTARVVGNLVLAIGLTYLSITGQLGWVLDAIVSIWLFLVIVPILGLGAFFWWAGRDIVQSSCPNCGNDFQIFKSSLNDELQLCPFCSQPFSVVDGKFVKERVNFSNDFTSKTRGTNEFSPQPRKGKDSSKAVVDIEAEVKDVD